MSTNGAEPSIPLRVGLAAIAWWLLLLVVWGIHDVGGVAVMTPVENPTAAEQVAIDEALGDAAGAQRKLVERFDCDSSPIRVATGDDGASAAPPLDVGFEYTDPPCSVEYESARSAVWVNLGVIVAVIAACVVLHVRGRRDAITDDDAELAAALIDD